MRRVLPILLIFSLPILSFSSYELKDLLFEKNQFMLNENQKAELKVIVETVKRIRKETKKKPLLLVNGNSDSTETKPVELSYKRARAVKEELIKLGLSKSQISIRGYGIKRPVTSSDPKNQRVDFDLALPID